MSDFFLDAFNALSGDEFDERPVDIRTFVESEDWLSAGPMKYRLSEYQYELINAVSQIYYRRTLVDLYGEEEAQERWVKTFREVIMQLGKGNFADYQKYYSVDKGYVDSYALQDGWMCDSRNGVQPAHPFHDEGPDSIYRVTTKKGYYFDCGPNHKTPTWKDTPHTKAYTLKKGPRDIKAEDLDRGDLIELKVGWSEPENPYDVTADEARLIGYMIGDGSFVIKSRRGNGWDYRNPMFTNATEEVQEDFVRIVESLGGSVTYLRSGKDCWQVRVRGLTKRFISWGLVRAYNEQKPWNDEWLSMSNANMTELIKGVLATDGWISFTAPGKTIGTGTTRLWQATAGIEMTSEECIDGLHLALLKVGVLSKFKKHRDSRCEGKHSTCYRIGVTDTSQVKRLMELLGDVPGKNDRVQRVLSMETKGTHANDRFDRIESVEYIGEFDRTVCTTVAEEGVLNAGGIITNNSGKDFTSTIAVAYVVYLCLCLSSPTKYFNNASIDIINVAINADQAQRVFFKNFMNHIRVIPWFQGKYDDKRDSVEFDKNVNVYSGHSEREAYEGYNTLIIILDEISGFALENTSGNHKAKTSEEIYNWARGSVTSRFSETGKIVSLSFPRFEDDFIQQKYKEVIADKEVLIRRATLKINPELSDGVEGNEFDIEWEEDHILAYKFPYTFALKRPSWEVNPTKDLQRDYALDFYRNPGDSYGRFACMPSNLEGGFFKEAHKIEKAFCTFNGVNDSGVFLESLQPRPDTRYYVHVDLAQKHDKCAVAMAHVDSWLNIELGPGYTEQQPVVKVDTLRWWTPTKDKSVDFQDVRNHILSLRRRGFDVRLATFDRWNSFDTMNILTNDYGIQTELLSVGKQHYDDFLSVMYEDRLIGPKEEELIKELGELRQVQRGQKVTIDHPAKGNKDLSDAVCGAIFNAVAHTPRDFNRTVEVRSLDDVRREARADEELKRKQQPTGVIRPPNPIPDELKDYMSRIRIL
jgi:hypothetical protein